jgi:predicted HTH transcriptional regulator
MLTLERREHLDQLHELQVGESLTLEYKASDAISNAPSAKVELARDVSAFANAAGGQIVYGMTEADHLPAGLDGGLERARFPGLWFEQVLQAHVSPAIEGLVLREIELGEGRIAAVITVPPAGARAPHQVSDGRYYRRRNFQRTHMEDYEVREAMRRHVQPEPYVTIALEAEPTPVVWPQPEPIRLPFRSGWQLVIAAANQPCTRWPECGWTGA